KKNEKTKYIPIIFLSAISKDQDYVYRGYETGAVDYLFKPIDTDILKNKVTVFLQLHRQKMELDNHRKTLTQKVTELQETQQKLLIANEELANLSALDGLTGIANRRRLDTFMENEWRRSLRKGAFFSLIMVDIDYFKSFNDNYGHLAGDECLKRIAAALASSLRRPSDLVARFGGEEFLAVLPETTMQEAKQVVTLLSKAIEILAIPHGYSHVADFITVSQGLASTIPQRNSKPLELLNAADEALYEAKNNGRNTVRCIELLL
ncbi:MAG: diguanylate cyclase, partial [bacterium]|nr:diguanylate cyclase [bacterium]